MSVIIGSAGVFLQRRETWKAFLKQRRLLHRFLNLISEEQRPRREEPSTTRMHPKICIFCQKTTAYKKVARTRDPLTQCVDLRADASSRKAADGRIIGLASRDFVAAEAWYHSQCYRDYNQTDKACKYSDLNETNYCDIESQASDKLYELIRLDLLENPRLVKKVDLREKLMFYMGSIGATEISESPKKHFRRKLEKEFGDLLQFEDLHNNNKLFVLPKNISTGQRGGNGISAIRQQGYTYLIYSQGNTTNWPAHPLCSSFK